MQYLDTLAQNVTDAGALLSSKVNRITDKTERLAPFIAGILIIVTFLIGIAKGLYRPLWFDEIYTTFIARFPHPSEFWSYARMGADGQPPFYYYIVKASVYLVGNEPLGVRLPSTIGYLLFCFSLYIFVSRMTTKVYGLAALLLPGITGCWYYLTEARPYGLVLGCTGLAAMSWQSVVRGRRRQLAVIGLGLSLTGAFAVHYFSLLLLAPFAIAELVRTIQRRKLDWAVWIALAVPLPMLALYLPVVLQASANGGVFSYAFARAAWYGSLQEFGNQFLGPSIVALIVVACVYIGFQCFFRPLDLHSEQEAGLKIKALSPEVALTLALTCLPVLAIALGKLGSHSFFPRYAIGAMFGLAALIVLIIWRALPGWKVAGLIVALVFCVGFAHTAVYDMREVQDERAVSVRQIMQNRIPKIVREDQLPIAIGDGFPFMELSYYGDPVLLSRICYLASPEYDLHYNGANNGELGLIRSAPYFGTHVVDFQTWTKSHRVFYLLEGRPFAIAQLIHDGAHLQLLQGGPDLFFRVSMPDQ